MSHGGKLELLNDGESVQGIFNLAHVCFCFRPVGFEARRCDGSVEQLEHLGWVE